MSTIQMFELIYYSIASPSLKKTDIADILEIARENNSKNDISGCLLYYNDAFLQILEGDQGIIEPLYTKIEQDKRHYNTRLIYSDNIQERLFKTWSMAFYDIDKDGASDNDKLIFKSNFITISSQTGQSTVSRELFWNISNQILNT